MVKVIEKAISEVLPVDTPAHESQIRKYLGGCFLRYLPFYFDMAIDITIQETAMIRVYTRLEIA